MRDSPRRHHVVDRQPGARHPRQPTARRAPPPGGREGTGRDWRLCVFMERCRVDCGCRSHARQPLTSAGVAGHESFMNARFALLRIGALFRTFSGKPGSHGPGLRERDQPRDAPGAGDERIGAGADRRTRSLAHSKCPAATWRRPDSGDAVGEECRHRVPGLRCRPGRGRQHQPDGPAQEHSGQPVVRRQRSPAEFRKRGDRIPSA